MKERIQTLAGALKQFDLDQVYIRPAVRELLDKVPSPSIMPNASEEKTLWQDEARDVAI